MDPLCQCGLADQNLAHVLQECPLQNEQRQYFWPQGVDHATKLWGTADDLNRTASFMASLNLSVCCVTSRTQKQKKSLSLPLFISLFLLLAGFTTHLR